MNRLSDYEILESYIPIAEFIAAICGPRYEVTLHNLEDLEHSIMFIAHGEITGRKPNDSLMDFALDTVMGGEYKDSDFGGFIPGKKTADNRELRFASYYIKNRKGKLIGLLCVTEDITDLLALQKLIDSDLALNGDYTLKENILLNKGMAISAKDMIDITFDHAKEQIGCIGKRALTKKQRMKIVEILNRKNLFTMKGAIPLVAKKMDISVPTMYRYLSELKTDEKKL